jgi:serine/threonine-protein kinase
VGATVGARYRLERVLGVGGMGAVFAAEHLVTGRPVALKRILPQLARDAGLRERFLLEARAGARLGHPGIADVLDAGFDAEGAPFLVFELLEGQDLAQAILHREVPPLRLLERLEELLEALAAAHGAGFVHRDVKPANIFLALDPAGRERAKLLDFGVVRALVRGGPGLTRAGAAVGTPWFMSPEQMAGDEVDPRADLWSVAVVLFYGLTGKLPFKSENAPALAAELVKGAPSACAARPELPAEVDADFARWLSPRLDARPRSAEALRAELRSLRERLAPRPRKAPDARPDASAPPWKARLDALVRETEALRRRGDGDG